MPFDDLAANHHAGALHIRTEFCGGELLHLPYDLRLDCCVVRSQCYRIYLDGNAYVANADAVRLLPYQQQLQPQFDGLLWLPPGGLPEHHDDWRERSEPRHGGISDFGFGVRDLPPDHHLGCRRV